MSYYEVRTGISRQQMERAYWLLALRTAGGLAVPTNAGAAPTPFEADTMQVLTQLNCSAGFQNMNSFSSLQWNESDQLFVGSQNGALLELRLPVAQTGDYRIDAYMTRAPDFGQVQVRLDGQALGAPIDLYAPVVVPTGPTALGVVGLTAGDHVLGFSVIGHNPSSRGYYFGLDCFSLVLQPN